MNKQNTMKILLLADAKPTLPIKELSKNCELIILLGDLFLEWVEELNEIDIPKIGIHGNHEKREVLEKIGAINLHLKMYEHKRITFTGFDGDMAYVYAENDLPYRENTNNQKLKSDLEELKNHPKADVFISHYPSFGTLDIPHIVGHRGIKAFSNYIERVKPKYHFHGHIHKNAQGFIGTTQVYCVYPHLIIDV